jgi:IMP dehydrogenase
VAAKKLVQDIMTKGKKLVTCGPTAKVGDAMKLMVTNRVSGLPVVDDAGLVVGVLTEADVLTQPKNKSIKSLMSDKPITLPADATIKGAAETLAAKKIKRALVLKDDGSLWGIVSRTDVIKAKL